MNIVQLQDQLKNFSQDQLVREMQMPSGNAPQFLVLGEIMRRKQMQQDFAAQKAKGDQGTVAQDAIAAAGVPQGGIADMARAMAPSTDMTQNTGVQAMAAGGTVRKMAEGDLIVRGGKRYVEQEDGSYLSEDGADRIMTTGQSVARDVSGIASALRAAAQPEPYTGPNPDFMTGDYTAEGILGMATPSAPAVEPTTPPAPLPQTSPLTAESVKDMTTPQVAALADQGEDVAINELRRREIDTLSKDAGRLSGASDVFMVTPEMVREDRALNAAAAAGATVRNTETSISALEKYVRANPDDSDAATRLAAAQEQLVADRKALAIADIPPSAATELQNPAVRNALAAQPTKAPTTAPAEPQGIASAATPDGGTSTGGTTTGGAGGAGGAGGTGGASGMSSYEQELMDVLGRREKAAEQDKWLALAQVGLNLMSSTQPTIGGALGEAGLKGVEAVRSARDQYDKDRLELLGAMEQSRMARAKLSMAGARGTGGLKPLSASGIMTQQKYMLDLAKSKLETLTMGQSPSAAMAMLKEAAKGGDAAAATQLTVLQDAADQYDSAYNNYMSAATQLGALTMTASDAPEPYNAADE